MNLSQAAPYLHPSRWLALLALTTLVPAEAQVFTGPSTRRTSIVLSEIHYHPAGNNDPGAEFIELYNSSPISVDLSGWKLRGDADFDIPANTRLEGGEFLVIAADPSLYPDSLGPWTGTLSNNNGTVRLRKASGGIVLETNYRDSAPWPLAADGAGHSLVLSTPSYGEGQPQAWSASRNPGGSPGTLDPTTADPLDQLIISEVRTTGNDFVELHNPGPGPVNLTDCQLSNNPDLPGLTLTGTLNPGQYLSLTGLTLNTLGDELYLRAPDGRVILAQEIGAQEDNHPWGGLTRWTELSHATPGTANADPFQRPVVINEVHYHPSNGENTGEFIELLNTSASPVDLSGWSLNDEVDFAFPPGTSIAANDFLVIAKNRTELLNTSPALDSLKVLGNYSGSLSNASARLELRTGGDVVADELTYFDGGRWPDAPDGQGTTLQLIDPRADNSLAPNWTAGDESAAAQTVTLEHTGILDLGHQKAPTATRFFILLGGKGEAIIDNVEVIVDGQNLLANGTFDSGSSDWKFFGTHSPSFAENGALHLVAADSGDLANLVDTILTQAINPGTTVTLRATCRWVSGDPDILLGLNGGWLEAAGTLPVPTDVGTPGSANVTTGNTGPAITEVSHFPLLPQNGEPVTVTARVTDPDDIATVRLRYRIDPSSSTQQVTMTHQGEGIYTGTIPAQTGSTMVAFHILTIDSASPGVISRFPVDATDRECLIKFGSANEPGALSTMHLWITGDTLSEWTSRTRSSNLNLDATFVSDGRVFYNAGVRYAGSDGGVTIYDSPIGRATGYNVTIPDDQVFLNVQRLTIDRETTRDATRQRERLLFWFLEKLGLPNLHRRYVHVFLNGIERDDLIMEDVQKPNSDVAQEWFAEKGRLTKTNPWFEFDANSTVINTNPGPKTITNRLQHYTTTGGAYKIPRYRWTWVHSAGHDNAHDFSGIFSLIDAAESPDSELVSRMREKADLRQWMRTFASNDLGAYWDTFGNPAAKNAYLFESLETGKWSVIVWDMDVGLGVFNDPFNYPLFPANVDDNIKRLYDQPEVVRDYWQAIDQALDTFFTATPGSEAYNILQETFTELRANDADVTSPFDISGPDGLAVDTWINQRRTFLQNQLSGKNAPFTASAAATSSTVFAPVSGTLPLATTTITANGIPLTLSHNTITQWASQVALQPGANTILIRAFDSSGTQLASENLTITYTGSDTWASLKINEWMASNSTILDPADSQPDDWFELYNPSASPVSLTGWALSDDPADPLKFIIPAGFTIPANGHLLVWADNEPLQNDPALRQELHVPFRLSSDGESIILTAPDATEIDRIDFSEQSSGIAQLRRPDGSPTLGFTTNPSPGTTNGTPVPATPVTVSFTNDGLTFPTNAGAVYQLETSTDLLIWTPSGAPLSGNGSPISLSPATPPAGRQFFRIKTY
ncbi:MAG: lamin tail domain-containing protein [Verrucomicrobiaceae bacterium]